MGQVAWFLIDERWMVVRVFLIDRWIDLGCWIQNIHIFEKNTKGMGQENAHI
jgi:hypothetical protein